MWPKFNYAVCFFHIDKNEKKIKSGSYQYFKQNFYLHDLHITIFLIENIKLFKLK